MIGQGLSCDEKGELADEVSEDTFEEALEDKPNDENVRFDEDLLKPLCALVYFRYREDFKDADSGLPECAQLPQQECREVPSQE